MQRNTRLEAGAKTEAGWTRNRDGISRMIKAAEIGGSATPENAKHRVMQHYYVFNRPIFGANTLPITHSTCENLILDGVYVRYTPFYSAHCTRYIVNACARQ